ncbi:ATP-binding protein [Rhizobacter sp. AJA081-3]|uniref:AAA family ATPase n=1 Tax=Rhizobacter sp. AJA081-3 TaxID=2753607 RepID=UPI001AE0A761|nr:ATP-binding protein [Rhizobacter sp. AJA081-3]QTN24867.1 ATP-binding protein [Rhizobacter sp. AJA081-3]
MSRAFVIGLLGAESTGKTTLAAELGAALAAPGRRVAVVPEYLREFCHRVGRTPRQDEQAGIAAQQSLRIAEAAESHDIVVADTTALMIAVYSEQVFGDTGLYDSALADHARSSLTLLTALDLPWQADGLQRDGPHVREPVDALVRAALLRAAIDCAVVFGQGPQRLANALAAVQRALHPPQDDGTKRWQWVCDRCGDAGCERHWLASL